MKIKPYIFILSLLCVTFAAHRGETAASDCLPEPAAFLLQSSGNPDSPADNTDTFNLAASETSGLCTVARRGNNVHRNTAPALTAGSLIPRSLLSRYFHKNKPLTRQHYNSGTVLARICVLII